MNSIKLFILLPVVFSAAALAAQSHPEKVIDLAKAKSQIEFEVVGHPGKLKIHGTTDRSAVKTPLQGMLRVTDQKISGNGTFTLEALDTGIQMRNRHMKEKYLETAKYPTAVLTLHDLNLSPTPDPEHFSKEGLDFEGSLSLHGVTKNVAGKASIVRDGPKTKLQLAFPVVLIDFHIEIPSFMGMTVAKDVKVTVEVEAD